MNHEKYESTLLIKSNTLLLKYIIHGAPIQLAFTMCGDRLLYAVTVNDDIDNGITLWSIVERIEELNGIRSLARGEPLVVFLFNELAINVAWKNFSTSGSLDRLLAWTDNVTLGQINHENIVPAARSLIDQLQNPNLNNNEWQVAKVFEESDWNSLHNYLITVGTTSSLIDLFSMDEGNQQEQLGIWLTDSLQFSGVHHSPQIPKGSGTRELTDIMLSYEFGTILIESKTLSILTRGELPSRKKLKHNISAHILKAINQLRGAIRALKSNILVTSPKGDKLSIERERPAHAIVLIPDLALVEDHIACDNKLVYKFMDDTGGFLHFLDISELLRTVQAAEMIARQNNAITPMMAFDHFLMERAKKACDARTLCIEVLLHSASNDEATPDN